MMHKPQGITTQHVLRQFLKFRSGLLNYLPKSMPTHNRLSLKRGVLWA